MGLFNFLRRGETFFVLELLPLRASGLVLRLDQEKRLTPLRVLENASWSELSGRLGRNRLIKNIIVSADSSIAYTAIIPVKIPREKRGKPLDAVELENLLAQGVGKVFNQCREEASRELGVDDLDIVLANSRVTNFRIDGHKVLNPMGFDGERVEAILELVLTTRTLLEGLKGFLKTKKNFFFTELARAELSALHRIHKLPLGLLSVSENKSAYFSMNASALGETIVRGNFDWGWKKILDSIMEAWGVDKETAKDIYFTYLKKEMSPSGLKSFAKILEKTSRSLLDQMKDSKIKGKIFVDTLTPLPFDLPLKKRDLILEEPPLGELIHRFGFTLEPSEWNMDSSRIFKWMVPILQFYSDKSNSEVNHWLRRHLSWLGSPVFHSGNG